MSMQELQDEGTMLASKYTDFEFSYSKRGGGTRATAELAIYRQHAAMFGFEADLHMLASPGERKKRQWGENPDAEDAPARSQEAELDRDLGQGRSTSPCWRRHAQYLSLATIATPAGPVAAQRAQRKRRALLTRVDLGRRRAGGLLSWIAGKQPRQWTSGSSSGGRGQQQQHVRRNYRARGL